MKTMMQMLQDLTPLNRAVCSRGYDQAVDYLKEVLPFRVISVPSSTVHNGWVIPPSWDVEEARIVKDGRTVYDGTSHPLGVIALSKSFYGVVSLEELQRHLYYDHRDDSSIPFHYRQQFRSWSRDWGFCVPKRLFDQLSPRRLRSSDPHRRSSRHDSKFLNTSIRARSISLSPSAAIWITRVSPMMDLPVVLWASKSCAAYATEKPSSRIPLSSRQASLGRSFTLPD